MPTPAGTSSRCTPRAAANVLGIRLREILREQLGGTYGVQVGYDTDLPPGVPAPWSSSSAARRTTSRSW